MRIETFNYDPSFMPPAPILEIEVDGYKSASLKRLVRVMVDSGADATMLPLSVLEAIGVDFKESLWMRGVAGGRVKVDLYLVGIRIGELTVPGNHVVAIRDDQDAVVGRDVLNQLVVTLDGIGSTTEVRV